MAASWDELPDAVLHDAKAALSKATEDKAGQEALANVFRSAEAAEKFAGVLVSLRMELDDSIGLSGEVCQSYCLFLIEIYQYIYHYFHSNLPGCRFQAIHSLESSLNMNWWLNWSNELLSLILMPDLLLCDLAWVLFRYYLVLAHHTSLAYATLWKIEKPILYLLLWLGNYQNWL